MIAELFFNIFVRDAIIDGTILHAGSRGGNKSYKVRKVRLFYGDLTYAPIRFTCGGKSMIRTKCISLTSLHPLYSTLNVTTIPDSVHYLINTYFDKILFVAAELKKIK